MATAADDRLHFTGDPEADRLLVAEPMALLIGFALDQQVPVQKAFGGPLELKRRIGHLEPGRIAAMDAAELDEAFRRRPALHRFPGAMAKRVQELAAAVARDHGGDAARIWTDAADGPDLRARLLALPAIGPMKADSLIAILGKRLGMEIPDLARVMPLHPTLGDVDSPEGLARYQAQKRAHKAELRAATKD
ncbi:MAG: HhH-GPD-type base excision DNA repair protein [Candidatus Limnocylindria bacterium]